MRMAKVIISAEKIEEKPKGFRNIPERIDAVRQKFMVRLRKRRLGILDIADGDDDIKTGSESEDKNIRMLREYNRCLARHFKYHKLGTLLYILQMVAAIAAVCFTGLIFMGVADSVGVKALYISLAIFFGLGFGTCVYLTGRYNKLAAENFDTAMKYDAIVREAEGEQ